MRDRTENQIMLILIRHGETPSNASGRYLGRTEEDLSAAGMEKLKKDITAGRYPGADMVLSSPMKRCRQTADLIYGCKKPILVEEWREMDFGRFEGKNYQELNGDVQYQAWIDSNGRLPFPEGESREEFTERCCRGLQRGLEKLVIQIPVKEDDTEKHQVKEEAAKGDRTKENHRKDEPQQAENRVPPVIAAVVHGGTIMALLSSYGAGDYFDYQCKNGEGFVCGLKHTDGKVTGLEIIRKL